MNLGDVMDELGDRLDTIDGLRVYRYPPDHVQPPCAVVTYPETYAFDETFGRGADRLSLPVMVMVGKAWDRSSRDRLVAYMAGAGDSSVKAVIESGAYVTFDSVRVQSVEVDVVQMAGVDYLAAGFTLDIIGPGSEAPVVDYSQFNRFGPADHGLISWAFDPSTAPATTITINGRVYLTKLLVRGEVEVSNVVWAPGPAGVSPAAGQNEVGIYDSDGNLLVSANVDAAVATIGATATPVTPTTVGPGFVWVGMVFQAATAPQVLRGEDFSGNVRAGNVGLAAATLRWAIAADGVTTGLPDTITPGSNTSGTFCGPWAALS